MLILHQNELGQVDLLGLVSLLVSESHDHLCCGLYVIGFKLTRLSFLTGPVADTLYIYALWVGAHREAERQTAAKISRGRT
jgi:hypothetical protein